MKEYFKGLSIKNKLYVILGLVLVIAFCVGITVIQSQKNNQDRQAMASVTSKATSLGLKDVSVACTHRDVNGQKQIYFYITCSNFSELSVQEMMDINQGLEDGFKDTSSMFYVFGNYYEGENVYEIHPDYVSLNWHLGREGYRKLYPESRLSSVNDFVGSTGSRKCSLCNGTGSVKYYYGSSAVEAWLDGQEDYTFGPCSRCDGTGRE